MTWRSYGGGSDLSGGYPIQISYTASGRLWSRMGTGATSWSGWRQVLDSVSQAYAYNMNQNVRSSDSPTFSELNVDSYIRHSGDANTYIRFVGADDLQLVAGGRQMLRMDEGGDPDILQLGDSATYTRNEGHLIVGQTAISYTNTDNTPLVGSKTNNRVHINGSIQLTNDNDAIVFGRGTSSFLKDEELGSYS